MVSLVWCERLELVLLKRSQFLSRWFCQSHFGLWQGVVVQANTALFSLKVVEDGYEFFAKRQLVTLFSAPNYCGEFDNAGAMMSVDETLMCSFQVRCREIYLPLSRVALQTGCFELVLLFQ